MSVIQLQQQLISDIQQISNENDLAKLGLFVDLLKRDVIDGIEQWESIPSVERERMIAASREIHNGRKGSIPQSEIDEKVRKWLG